MIRWVIFLLGVSAAAVGLAWLADRPGTLHLAWEGWDVETSVFRAVVLMCFLVGLVALITSIIRQIWSSPAALGRFISQRRQERGLDAISGGMIAIGAGDSALATRYAVQARKALPNEPLTQLLRAQAAQISGDRTTARRIYEAMLSSPDTEQLGLRGLYLEALEEREPEAARQFAERALALNPKLGWSVNALFDQQCREKNWAGALETLATAKKYGHVEKAEADRRRAVLLTAQAQEAEDQSLPKALDLALEAHNLASDLIPAAAIAGRQLASRGSTPKAAKVIEKTWRRAQHPDLALVYAHVRPGDSPRDRLDRLKRLARSTPHSNEGPIAIATAAIDARDWAEARAALEPLLADRVTQRVCTLMARIEGGEHENTGGVREWLARAVNAPRDPVWTADGVIADRWEAISPVTGALDAFQWKVPVETAQTADSDAALEKMEEFVALGVRAPAPDEERPADVDDVIEAEEIETPAPAAKLPAVPAVVAKEPKAASGLRDASIDVAPPSTQAAPKAASNGSHATAAVSPAKPAAPASEVITMRPVPATGSSTGARVSTAGSASLYVAPRPPDDPGPDDAEDEPRKGAAVFVEKAGKV